MQLAEGQRALVTGASRGLGVEIAVGAGSLDSPAIAMFRSVAEARHCAAAAYNQKGEDP